LPESVKGAGDEVLEEPLAEVLLAPPPELPPPQELKKGVRAQKTSARTEEAFVSLRM
jgi:hypothetical protein